VPAEHEIIRWAWEADPQAPQFAKLGLPQNWTGELAGVDSALWEIPTDVQARLLEVLADPNFEPCGPLGLDATTVALYMSFGARIHLSTFGRYATWYRWADERFLEAAMETSESALLGAARFLAEDKPGVVLWQLREAVRQYPTLRKTVSARNRIRVMTNRLLLPDDFQGLVADAM